MARPLRIEFPGAVYHVTSRGDRHESIFADDTDRRRLLGTVGNAMQRLDAEVLAYCLMGNHYHFVLRTRQANLSRLMRQINGEYTRTFNRRHEYVGHLFQGRFHAILIDSDAYLTTACRYVELNPVRAAMVRTAADWPWSSFRAHSGMECGPSWLATQDLYGHILGREPISAEDHQHAARLYAQGVAEGSDGDIWGAALSQEIFLGDQDFVARMQSLASLQRLNCVEVPRAQRTRSISLSEWLSTDRTAEESLRLAYSSGGLTMAKIAEQMNISIATVSRWIARAERTAKCKVQDLTPGESAKCKT
ncbi:MAG: transposase [Betaproteobacteria bacterium]